MSMFPKGFMFSFHGPKPWTLLESPVFLAASHPLIVRKDSSKPPCIWRSMQTLDLRYNRPVEMVFSHLNVVKQGHRHQRLVYYKYMKSKTIKINLFTSLSWSSRAGQRNKRSPMCSLHSAAKQALECATHNAPSLAIWTAWGPCCHGIS